MKLARGWTQPREAYCDLRLPAALQQIFRVGGERECFLLPPAKSEQSADPEPAKSGSVTALCAIEPPVEIALGTGRVQVGVDLAIVRFLINHEALRACFYD